MVANLTPQQQDTDEINIHDVAIFRPMPSRDEWVSRYYDDNTRLNDVQLATSHKRMTCAVCGGLIAPGHDALFGADGEAIHMNEYECAEILANSPKVPTHPTSPKPTPMNGTAHSEIEDALAKQRAAVERTQADIHESVNKLDTWSNVHSQPLVNRPLPLPDFPRNWDEYRERYHARTTPEFMAVLDTDGFYDEIWHLFGFEDGTWGYCGKFYNFMQAFVYGRDCFGKYRITRYGDLYDQPQPAPATEPDDTAPKVTKFLAAVGEAVDGGKITYRKPAPQPTWTVAKVEDWLRTRLASRDEKNQASTPGLNDLRATADDIRDHITAIRRLIKQYQLQDELADATGLEEHRPNILLDWLLTNYHRKDEDGAIERYVMPLRIIERNDKTTLFELFKKVQTLYTTLRGKASSGALSSLRNVRATRSLVA